MVFNSPCLTDKKELIHHEGTALLKWYQFHWIMPFLGTKGLASPEQMATDAVSFRDIQLICTEFSSIQVKTKQSGCGANFNISFLKFKD
ncbi:hypothetical protein Tco_1351953 [Tanacetum coccineum]